MSSVRISSRLTVRDTDPLVREHRVQDIHILPGVSLLDVTYKVMAAARIDTTSVVLRDILFHEPVVTHAEADRKLTVTVEQTGDGGRVTVTSVPWKDDRALSGSVTSHMVCAFQRDQPFPRQALDPGVAPLTEGAVDLDACYSVTRHIGIFHDDFMKCRGTVAPLPSGDFIGTVSLSDRAYARSSDFVLHPVFLDCSTIVPLFHLRNRIDEANLFIPFAIEEFRALPLTGRRQVRVVVEKPEEELAGREILYHSFGLYDLDGRPLAYIRKFGVKRVRSLEGIRRLLAKGSSLRAVPPLPPASPEPPPRAAEAAPAPAPKQEGEPLFGLIGSLMVRHGKADWSKEDESRSFFDLGLDSLALLDLSEALEQQLKIRLYPTLLFERPTAAALVAYLREAHPAECAAYEGKGGETPREEPGPREPVTAERPVEAPQVLVPRWLPVHGAEPVTEAKAIVLLGAGEESELLQHLETRLAGRVSYQETELHRPEALADLRAALERGLACDEIWLVAAGHEVAFSLVKALLASGRLQSPLALKALTLDGYRVHQEAPDAAAAHGLWGLLQSLSREHPGVSVSQLDLARSEVARAMREGDEEWLRMVAQCGTRTRALRALRAGRLYERRLLGVRPAEAGEVPLRQAGIYAVIGGAGGVGMELVRHLRQKYGARVAIIGRRPLEEELQRRLSAEGEYGRDILYVSASIDEEPALGEALQRIRAHFGGLNGLVHSAMVLEDRRLADMDADTFERVLRPKVTGSQVLARVTEGLELDFILFFSSVQSFVGNVSQGNYAAASTYLDGFAAAMRAQRPYPVVVINWGYWSEVGAVATERYRSLLARQGVHGLRAGEALAVLEQVLAAGWEQAAIVAAEEPVLEEMGLSRALVLGRSRTREPVEGVAVPLAPEALAAARPVLLGTKQAMELLLPMARHRVAQLLRDLELLGTGASTSSVDEAVRSGRLASEHARFVRALVHHLEAAHALDAGGLGEQEFSDALTRLAGEHASLRPLIPLLRACIEAYPRVLTGKTPAMEVVFPGGSIELVRLVYGDSEVSRFYNEVVARAVRTLASAGPRRPLRILEVGAGTGATTLECLRALGEAGIDCEYWYTDLFDKLIADARSRLGPRYPALRFSFLDIGTDPALQGLREEFDVVVATNVLHATRDLHLSLRHVKKLLRPGGALVLNESVEVQEFSTYTFGLLPGWWSATDPHERLPDSPLATASGWSALLKDEGFVQVSPLVPDDGEGPALTAQQVFLAWSDGEVRLAGERKTPRLEVVSQSELPRALVGKLRPLDLAALAGGRGSKPRCIATYQDTRDNVWIFLNNPPANTFTDELLEELCTSLQRLSTLAPDVLCKRFIYLSHFGEYFSLGGDRSELVRRLAAGEHEGLGAFANKARTLLSLMSALGALVVAVVNGTAQGGGLETLLATDLQLVRDGVRVGLPEIKSGLIPGMGGLTYLKELIGLPRVKRLVMLGELLSAREALELGIISHVVEDPFEAALALAEELQHLETALYMKQILGRDKAERLVADIDEWLAYMIRHAEWIDARRISDSQKLLMGRAAAKAV